MSLTMESTVHLHEFPLNKQSTFNYDPTLTYSLQFADQLSRILIYSSRHDDTSTIRILVIRSNKDTSTSSYNNKTLSTR